MLAGVAIGAVLGHLTNLNDCSWWLLVALGAPLAAPAFLDVMAQNISSYRSNLIRRIITGVLLGLGIVCFGTAMRTQIAAMGLERFNLAFSHMP